MIDDVVLRRFDSPDETRVFEKGLLEVVRIGGMTVARATYQPGWKWSQHVGPLTGAARCEVEHVGIHDNFFDLGGHSLVMVQVHSALQAFYGLDLSLVDMFRYPTVSALAQYIDQAESEPSAVQHGDERAAMRQASSRRQRQSRQERRLDHEAQRAQHE